MVILQEYLCKEKYELKKKKSKQIYWKHKKGSKSDKSEKSQDLIQQRC